MTPSVDSKLLDALAGLDAGANMEVVQRTRRAVMVAANRMREGELRARRNLGMMLLAVGMLLMFLTPTLWVMSEDMFNGGHWLDSPTLTALLVMTVAPAIFAAVVAQWSNRTRRERA
ncbi:MAG TPA: hypothetical protein VMU92_09670 [Acidobacteriaceae bacterium]|nr:hypothetical protein [Acidobacteriaceae bacterium]